MGVQQEQAVPKKHILPPTYLLAAIVLMAVLHFLLPLRRVLTFPWRLLGIVPFLVGVALNLAADRQFTRHGTTVKPFERSTSLITTGVYRISRNPMYLGFVLILLGIAVFLGSLSPFFITVVFAVLMDFVFIQTEERMIATEFGEAWLAYKAMVRKWV
jgi:protein-S-isoprenylcysteine O-methyltransferase Ste14